MLTWQWHHMRGSHFSVLAAHIFLFGLRLASESDKVLATMNVWNSEYWIGLILCEGTKTSAAADRSPGQVPALCSGEGAGGARQEPARCRRRRRTRSREAAGETTTPAERRVGRRQLPDRRVRRGHPLHRPLLRRCRRCSESRRAAIGDARKVVERQRSRPRGRGGGGRRRVLPVPRQAGAPWRTDQAGIEHRRRREDRPERVKLEGLTEASREFLL